MTFKIPYIVQDVLSKLCISLLKAGAIPAIKVGDNEFKLTQFDADVEQTLRNCLKIEGYKNEIWRKFGF